ncbi:hypothetical protein ABIB27_001821 [Arthrobacter sp. UYEF21]
MKIAATDAETTLRTPRERARAQTIADTVRPDHRARHG